MFTKPFWILASERALKTVAQTFLSMAAAVGVFDALQADWQTILGVSVGAGLLSYATSVVSAQIGEHANPSIVAIVSDPAREHWDADDAAERAEMDE